MVFFAVVEEPVVFLAAVDFEAVVDFAAVVFFAAGFFAAVVELADFAAVDFAVVFDCAAVVLRAAVVFFAAGFLAAVDFAAFVADFSTVVDFDGVPVDAAVVLESLASVGTGSPFGRVVSGPADTLRASVRPLSSMGANPRVGFLRLTGSTPHSVTIFLRVRIPGMRRPE